MRILLFGLLVFLLSCQQQSNDYKVSKYYTDSIHSKYLSEYRKHNIYLPAGFEKSKKYPIIYKTDGSEIKNDNFLKTTLDSLIHNKIIQPIIVIESHSNTKIADSISYKTGAGEPVRLMYRNFEYIPDYNKDAISNDLQNRFTNHMHYFKDELLLLEKELGQSATKEDRVFYGYSNGAGFGMCLLNKYPEFIGTYLCFSDMGGNVNQNQWNANVTYPDLYYVYGQEEAFLIDGSAKKLKEVYNNSESELEIIVFEGGHDYKFWYQYFISRLVELFGN
jgi:enterochelin esterase-like enzyme